MAQRGAHKKASPTGKDWLYVKNLYLMSGTDAFTKGGLDNVALAENAVCLGVRQRCA